MRASDPSATITRPLAPPPLLRGGTDLRRALGAPSRALVAGVAPGRCDSASPLRPDAPTPRRADRPRPVPGALDRARAHGGATRRGGPRAGARGDPAGLRGRRLRGPRAPRGGGRAAGRALRRGVARRRAGGRARGPRPGLRGRRARRRHRGGPGGQGAAGAARDRGPRVPPTVVGGAALGGRPGGGRAGPRRGGHRALVRRPARLHRGWCRHLSMRSRARWAGRR
jgi:hypothetical protein